ncbi:MAG: DUF342 domain-containing protein, partial [Spirochaetota bacterium]
MKFLMTYFDPVHTKMLVQKTNESGKKTVTVSTPYNFVSRNEIIMRVVDVDSEEDARKYLDTGYEYYNIIPNRKFTLDSSVYYDEKDHAYRSNWYGFVLLDQKGNLRVSTPLQISKDKTQAFFFIYPTKFGKIPAMADITEELSTNKIVTPVDAAVIEKGLMEIDPSKPKLSRIKVAQSKAPVNGQNEYFEPLIELERRVGKVEMDGHIDYREVGTIQEVKKGTPLLKRYPKVQPENGYTIYGEKANAEMLPPKGLAKGDNLVPSHNDPDIFVAGVDGCIQKQNRKVSVLEMAIVSGDVDYESGNIDFSGTVEIKGNVLPGFQVKAGGDITIWGNIDDAVVESGGSLTVRQGIAGKGNTRVICDGGLFAKYIVNSTVESKGNITVDESIINSHIFSNDKVLVTSDHSKIMGGKVMARHRIEVASTGSNKETLTEVMVGRNLMVERMLDSIRKEISAAQGEVDDVLNNLKSSFGTQLFENPKAFISVLPQVKKKQCVTLLGELSKQKSIVAELKEKAAEVEKKLVLDEEPLIIIKNT